MSLGLFQRSRDLALSIAAANPVIDTDAGFGDALFAAYDARRKFKSSDSESGNRYDYVQGIIDRLTKETGEQYLNPEGVSPGRAAIVAGGVHPRAFHYAKVRNRLAQLQKERPDLGLGLLSEEEIAQGGEEIARKAVGAEGPAQQRHISWSSSAGAFIGEAAGTLRDPVNLFTTLATLPLTRGRSVMGAGAQEGGIGAASEMLVQAMNYDYRRRVDPEFTLADAMGEVGIAAGGAFAFGAGVRGIAKAWDAKGDIPRYIPQRVKDKANIVLRAAAAARSPFKTKNAAADVTHNQAIAKASEDLMMGRPVELPPETFLAANARPGRVYDADGRSVGVNYEVVEARDLVTSHTDDFLPNEAFPSALQPRIRERRVTREQVSNMAAGLQPERLGPSPQADSGAPIIGPDGLVESGNGRVMALRKAYRDIAPRFALIGGRPREVAVAAASYRNFLKRQGFNIDGMDEPILVARRVTDLPDNERAAFVASANRATAMRLSATEQALADARLIEPSTLQTLEAGDIASTGNRPFVRSFLSKLPRSEHGSLVDADGNLSADGARRVSAALLGRAYGEPALLARALEDADSNVKALAGALTDAAGAWSKLRDAVSRGAVPQGMDITDDLVEAMRLVIKSRDEKTSFKELLGQAEMFDGPSDIAKAIGKFMFRDGDFTKPASRAAVADMLRTFAAEAEKNVAGDRLFGEALGEGDILKTALERAGRGDLAPEALARLEPDAIDKMIDDPEVDAAVLRDGERMMAEELTGSGKPVMVAVRSVDAARNETEELRPLIEVMDELDEQITAAERIEACAGGGTAKAAPSGSGSSEVSALREALQAPRKVSVDKGGRVTGIEGQEAFKPSPELNELLDALRAPKTFNLDAEGNVIGVEIKK